MFFPYRPVAFPAGNVGDVATTKRVVTTPVVGGALELVECAIGDKHAASLVGVAGIRLEDVTGATTVSVTTRDVRGDPVTLWTAPVAGSTVEVPLRFVDSMVSYPHYFPLVMLKHPLRIDLGSPDATATAVLTEVHGGWDVKARAYTGCVFWVAGREFWVVRGSVLPPKPEPEPEPACPCCAVS